MAVDDGFTMVGRKNKPVASQNSMSQDKSGVLVRGSGYAKVMDNTMNEDIHVKNSFNVLNSNGDNVEDLGDIKVNEEFESKVWPDLKEEVDILLEAGIYPSKQVRLDWSIHQMDYFYKNCHKFHLDPCCEDDEGDVDSDDEGFAWNVRGLNNTPNQDQSAQVMHCFIEPINGNPGFFYSFVYACVLTVDKRSLWKSLSIHKNVVKDRPWIILEIDVEDIAMTGLNFTWNKKPGDDGGLLKKLDRVLGNSHFMSIFPLSYAHFLPFMLSDHTPAVIVMPKISKAKLKPFKFYNYLTDKDDFIPIVRNVWNSKIDGFAMFSLVSKLKLLKKSLRKLNFEQEVTCLRGFEFGQSYL
nr:hypothetical protein [Tanacetum cinerariifolium]